MENAKENITKKKKTKKVLCYFGLVILTVLLFTPMAFKIAFRNTEPAKKEDVITSLTCRKEGEMINSSFINDVPQNIRYTLPGTYKPDGTFNDDENSEKSNNPVLKKFLNYSYITNDQESNTSVISFDVSVANGSIDAELYFNNISMQEEYFKTNGFTCITQTIS